MRKRDSRSIVDEFLASLSESEHRRWKAFAREEMEIRERKDEAFRQLIQRRRRRYQRRGLRVKAR